MGFSKRAEPSGTLCSLPFCYGTPLIETLSSLLPNPTLYTSWFLCSQGPASSVFFYQLSFVLLV